MNDQLSVSTTGSAPRPFRPTSRRFYFTPLLAVLASLQCASLQAEESDAAYTNSVNVSHSSLPWMSGGVGDEAREEMRRVATSYNVHLVFSDRQGAYLADIPFTVSQLNGQELYSGTSPGPLLYLKLPPGSYQVSARIDGIWQKKRVQAGTAGHATKASFIARGE